MALQEREALTESAVELPEPWRSAAVTVVLPTYNEAANLPVIVAELLALPLSSLRILVADDNSPDGTGDIADKLAGQYGPDKLTVVHRQEKQGLGRAYVDGMTRAVKAGAEFVVQMDSDLSHAPKYLPQMLGTLLAANADVVSIRSNGYSFQVEMNYRSVRHGLKIVELPIHFAERRDGESKMNVWVQLESALMPFVLRRRVR